MALFLAPAQASANGCDATNFGGGDGSSGDPFQVSTAFQLAAMDSNACLTTSYNFKQTASIDLEGVVWEPLNSAEFNGSYDGGFHSIINLTTENAFGGGVFFVINGGTVKNLRIENAEVVSTGNESAGVLASEIKAASTITKISVTDSTVQGMHQAGSIAGMTRGARSTFSEIVVVADVNADNGNAGGLIGQIEYNTATITNSSFSGTVNSDSAQMSGGIVGYGIAPIIEKAFSTATVTGGTLHRGGIIGNAANTSIVDDSYFLDTGVVELSSNFATASTESELTSISHYTNWLITSDLAAVENETATETWLINSEVNNGYPILVWDYMSTRIAPPQQASPPVFSAPVPFSGPVVNISNQTVSAGSNASIRGIRMDMVNSVTIGEVEAEILESSSTELVVSIPAGLEMGVYDLILETAGGNVLIDDALEVDSTEVESQQSLGPDSGDFSAWTKRQDNNQVKFYAQFPELGQKIQFMVQGESGEYEEIAWLRVDQLSESGDYQGLQNGAYFVRTLDLQPGKNRLRIYVDGEQLGSTKTYSFAN